MRLTTHIEPRPLLILFFFLTGWANRAGGLVIAVLAVDALLQATGLLIWFQTGSTLAVELIITVFFYVFVSIVHCVTGGWTHGIWVGGLLIQPVMSSLFLYGTATSGTWQTALALTTTIALW